jgi:simple sugar transport system ATP-binding protein
MVHQHFKLVDLFTATENVVLGLTGDALLNRKAYTQEISEISERYGFALDPEKKVYNMSVSEKQTVEIVKVLYSLLRIWTVTVKNSYSKPWVH